MAPTSKSVSIAKVLLQAVLAWLATLVLNAAVTYGILTPDRSPRGELIGQAVGVFQQFVFVCLASLFVARLWRARGLAGGGAWLVSMLVFGAAFAWGIIAQPNVEPFLLMLLAGWGGVFLSVTVGTVLGRKSTTASRVCPWCAEAIRAEAVVCRFCGRGLPGAVPPPLPGA